MKRRRTKDYVYVFESLITEAAVHGYKIDFMIDFELAAKKAIEIIFSKCIVKGCLFHYSQSLNRKLSTIGRLNI